MEKEDNRFLIKAYCQDVINEIIDGGAYKVTKYLGDTTLKATRKMYKRYTAKDVKRAPIEIMITIGKANYEERLKIKQAKIMRQPLDWTAKYPPKKETK